LKRKIKNRKKRKDKTEYKNDNPIKEIENRKAEIREK